jgi:hypothetical protein
MVTLVMRLSTPQQKIRRNMVPSDQGSQFSSCDWQDFLKTLRGEFGRRQRAARSPSAYYPIEVTVWARAEIDQERMVLDDRRGSVAGECRRLDRNCLMIVRAMVSPQCASL